MTNPYEPTVSESSDSPRWSTSHLHAFAGWWLAIAGLIHFVAVNMQSGARSFSSIDWSPAFLVVLGTLILFRVRIATMLTRLIGSFVIVGIVVAFVLIEVGFGDGAELTYGNTTVTDPPPWKICLLLLVIGGTLVPPWWALQRALADNHRVRWRGGG